MGLLGTACLSVHSRRRGSGREVQGVAVLGEDRRRSASISHATSVHCYVSSAHLALVVYGCTFKLEESKKARQKKAAKRRRALSQQGRGLVEDVLSTRSVRLGVGTQFLAYR